MLVHPHSSSTSSSSSAEQDDNGDSLSDDEQRRLQNKKQKIAGVLGQSNSLLLEMIPSEVLESHVLSYLTNGRDYHSLQLTCKAVKDLSNKMDILKYVDLNGDVESGKESILNGVESPVVAVERLYKFANAGNQQALYM